LGGCGDAGSGVGWGGFYVSGSGCIVGVVKVRVWGERVLGRDSVCGGNVFSAESCGNEEEEV
jgi:hypothetical protein